MNSSRKSSTSRAVRFRELTGCSVPCRRMRSGWPDTRWTSEPPWLTASSRNASMRFISCRPELAVDDAQQLRTGEERREAPLVLGLQERLVGIDLAGAHERQERLVHELHTQPLAGRDRARDLERLALAGHLLHSQRHDEHLVRRAGAAGVRAAAPPPASPRTYVFVGA